LFQQGDIVSIEDRAEEEGAKGKGEGERGKSSKDTGTNDRGNSPEAGRGLGIGSLREVGR
jgi:hypothetical protein